MNEIEKSGFFSSSLGVGCQSGALSNVFGQRPDCRRSAAGRACRFPTKVQFVLAESHAKSACNAEDDFREQ